MKTTQKNMKKLFILGIGLSCVAVIFALHNQGTFASLMFNSNIPVPQNSFTDYREATDITVTSSGPLQVDNTSVAEFNYGVRAINTTLVPAENVVVKTIIPTSLTIVTLQAGCVREGNNTMVCTIPSFAAGASRNFLVRVSAPARSLCGLTLTNTASVTTSTAESSTNNNQSMIQTGFSCGTATSSANSSRSAGISSRSNSSATTSTTDISVEMQAPEKMNNDNATDTKYRIVVRNTSAVSALRVTTSIILPQMLTIPSVPSGCIKHGNEVVCTMESMNGNSEQDYIIEARTSSRNPCNQAVESIAKVSTSTNEVKQENNRSGGTTYFECSVSEAEKTDVVITNITSASVSNDYASTISYNITITNKGQVAAKNIVIEDIIASALTVGTVPQGCTKSGNTVRCSIENLDRNTSRSFTINASAAARTLCNQTVDSIASVSTDTPETTVENNKASARTTFTCSLPQTDISIPNGNQPSWMNNGYPVTLSFGTTVSNISLVNAENVVVNVAIPSPFVVGTLPANCTQNGNTVTCSIGPMRFITSANVTIKATAPARSMCDQTVTQSISVSTSTPESNTANNQASKDFTFFCTLAETNLVVTNSAPSALSNSNESSYSYTVTVANTSDTDAYNVAIDHRLYRYSPYPGSDQYRAINELAPFILGTLSDGCVQAKIPFNNKIRCSVGLIRAHDIYTYVVRVTAPAQSICRNRVVFETTVTTTTPERRKNANSIANLTVFSCDEATSTSSTNSSSRASSVVQTSSVSSRSSVVTSSRSSAVSSSSIRVSSRSSSSIAASITDLSIAISAPISLDNNVVSTINFAITVKNE